MRVAVVKEKNYKNNLILEKEKNQSTTKKAKGGKKRWINIAKKKKEARVSNQT